MTELHSLQTSPATLAGILCTFALLLYVLHGVYRPLWAAIILRCLFLFALALSYTFSFMDLSLWLENLPWLSGINSWAVTGITLFGADLLAIFVLRYLEKRKLQAG